MGVIDSIYLIWIPSFILLLGLIYCVKERCKTPEPIPPLTVVRTAIPLRRAKNTDETCCICLEPVAAFLPIPALRCRHAFHAACLERWVAIRSVCPLCQIDI